jgi:hypothetical protein
MTDKYDKIRADIDRMKNSYGNKFPISFHPDTILELLDDLNDLVELNDLREAEIAVLKEELESKTPPKRTRKPQETISEEVKGDVASDPTNAS